MVPTLYGFSAYSFCELQTYIHSNAKTIGIYTQFAVALFRKTLGISTQFLVMQKWRFAHFFLSFLLSNVGVFEVQKEFDLRFI